MAKTPNLLSEVPVRRAQARERFYVLCQSGGWGVLLATQITFMQAFRSGDRQVDELDQICATVMVALLGLLLTHIARGRMALWGWKQMGWRALLPRVIGCAVALSLLWSFVGYGYLYGVLRQPWPSKFPPALLVTISVMNGTVVMIGWLCIYFFYHLFDRYNRLEIERLQLQASVKEAELRALRSQVNPHFMFNSLNSVRALIDEDPARARRAVTQLANLLRYSLQSGQLETVAFEDELRTVNDYLALEQVRHEERLRLRLEIAPEALRQRVPPMLLQTFVENAVKYGISSRADGGEIGIVARCADGRLELRVTNPGTLARAAGGDALPGGPTSTGLGLQNASQRLRLLFGDRATFRLRESADGLVSAEVSIPLADEPGAPEHVEPAVLSKLRACLRATTAS